MTSVASKMALDTSHKIFFSDLALMKENKTAVAIIIENDVYALKDLDQGTGRVYAVICNGPLPEKSMHWGNNAMNWLKSLIQWLRM